MRRRVFTGLIFGVTLTAVLGTTGCAQRPLGHAADQLVIDAVQPSMPAWARDVPASKGVVLGDTDGTSSMPWKLAAIADDRRTITVVFVAGDGDCVTHAGHALQVDGTTIVLGEYSTTASAVGSACTARLGLGVETVTLPLALDGSVQLAHAQVTGNEEFPA